MRARDAWTSLWPAVRRRLREVIPFEVWALATIDPTTLLPTAGMRQGLPEGYCSSIVRNEVEVDDFDKVAVLTRSSTHVGILGISTGGHPERSARYREILDPIGIERQARAVCVARGGCWAWLDLYRERGSREFTLAEARTLDRVARHMAEAIRVSLLLADGPARGPDDEAGPSRCRSRRWRQGPCGEMARGDRRGSRSARGGRWLALHCFRPRGRSGVAAAVVLEPAAPLELAEMRVRAFGLTATERRVLELTLWGLSTKEIAASLRISPYTARDHLTHVFDKTGARSRAQLFALLASTQQVNHALETGEDAIACAAGKGSEARHRARVSGG